MVAANAAPPYMPGEVVGEPNVGLANIRIEREVLTFDLRPLVDGQSVPVTATYELNNQGTAAAIDLVFVAASIDDSASGVWLDGHPVPAERPDPGTGAPPAGEWDAPRDTPALDGGRPLYYETRTPGSIFFTIDLPPGRHDMEVRYFAAPGAHQGDIARYWQLGYVLAPAREWGGFGSLEVAVQLPPNWSFAAEPALTRNGDSAHGSFAGIPADSIAMTAQMPIPVARPNYAPAIVLLALGLAGVLLAGWLGSRRGRRGLPASGLIGVSITWALLSALAYVAAAIFAKPAIDIPASQETWGYSGIGDPLAEIVNLFMAFIGITAVVTLLFLLVASIAARRASRSGTPGPAPGWQAP